jgi:hypothetical protein
MLEPAYSFTFEIMAALLYGFTLLRVYLSK